MLCILCISQSDQMLNIFDENGINLNISKVIMKHFWLQPNAEMKNAQYICCSCWTTLESFHTFYNTIEEAHIKLNASIKLPDKEDEESTHFDSFSELFTTVVKQESSDDATNVELLEMPEIIQPIDAVTKTDDDKEVLNSVVSESEDVPNLRSSLRNNNIDKIKDSESDSDESYSEAQDNDNIEEEDSDSDSDYKAPKKKAKVKKASTSENGKKFGKSIIPVSEFDSYIKKNMKISCSLCSKPSENFFSLKEHFKKVHKKDPYVTCCDKKWTSRFALVHHLLLHENPDLYKCAKCSQVLANKRSYKRHMESHIIQERIHPCTKCKKKFSSIPKLEKHIKSHIRRHADQICEQCGKVCHSKQSLSAHQKREHMGFVKQKVQCTKCGKYMADSSTLRFHMKYQHPTAEVVNLCTICGHISASGYGLKRHIQFMHTMERVHKCTICEDKAFKTAQALREHMTTHTGEVLYTCPHCPKTFNSNANMHSHRKKMHRKEWEENRRHPHMGHSAQASVNNANANAIANATEENNQQ